MPWRTLLLSAAASAVAIPTCLPTDAFAARRVAIVEYRAPYCGGQLPAWGYDACGFREFSYGPGSCWRRVIVDTPLGPQPRRVAICGVATAP
jgi:hypothetical protein